MLVGAKQGSKTCSQMTSAGRLQRFLRSPALPLEIVAGRSILLNKMLLNSVPVQKRGRIMREEKVDQDIRNL